MSEREHNGGISEPTRVQRSRAKGWRMPPNTVYVGRGSAYGNPFKVGAPHPLTGEPMPAEACVDLYRRGIVASMWAWPGGPRSIFSDENIDLYRAWEAVAPHLDYTRLELCLPELKGKNVACWCGLDQACHGDALLDLANGPRCEEVAA